MPKPDAPFNMIWRTLDRALSMPVFNKHEVCVMQAARELSYTSSVMDGTGRAKTFNICATDLAERRGLLRQKVCKAVADLLADGVFTGTRDALRINKHYRQWKGSHSLTDRQIRECDDASHTPVTASGVYDGAEQAAPEPAPECQENAPEGCHQIVTPLSLNSDACHQIVTPGEKDCHQIVTKVSPDSDTFSGGHIGTPAELNSIQSQSKASNSRETSEVPEPDDEPDLDDLPQWPIVQAKARPAPTPDPTGAVGKNPHADVVRALAEAERLWPLGSMRTWVHQWLHEHSAAFVIRSMLRASDKRITWPAAYVQKILDDGEQPAGGGSRAAAAPPRPMKIFTAAGIDAEMRREMEADDLAYAQSQRGTNRV